jgi:hypothetical protein
VNYGVFRQIKKDGAGIDAVSVWVPIDRLAERDFYLAVDECDLLSPPDELASNTRTTEACYA